MLTSHTIPQNTSNNAFFAGCEIVYDDTLPPNSMSLIVDKYEVVWNVTTGEILEVRHAV